MIVCHCNRVSDRAIRDAVRNGASSRSEVAMACRAGRSCGGCVGMIDKIINIENSSDCAGTFDCTPALAEKPIREAPIGIASTS